MNDPVTLEATDHGHLCRAIVALQLTPPQDAAAVRGHAQSIVRLCEIRDALVASQQASQVAAHQLRIAAEWIKQHPDDAMALLDSITAGGDNAEPVA